MAWPAHRWEGIPDRAIETLGGVQQSVCTIRSPSNGAKVATVDDDPMATSCGAHWRPETPLNAIVALHAVHISPKIVSPKGADVAIVNRCPKASPFRVHSWQGNPRTAALVTLCGSHVIDTGGDPPKDARDAVVHHCRGASPGSAHVRDVSPLRAITLDSVQMDGAVITPNGAEEAVVAHCRNVAPRSVHRREGIPGRAIVALHGGSGRASKDAKVTLCSGVVGE